VIYDIGSTNPFKEFLSLVPSSRVLCHIIVSIAALHQAQREPNDSQMLAEDTSGHELDTTKTLTKLPKYYEYLYHKQQALYLLRTQYQGAPFQDTNGVIASILMFVWLECLECGRNTWAYHLNALKEIMQARSLSMDLVDSKNVSSAFSRFYEFFDTSYAMLGLTYTASRATTYLTLTVSKSSGRHW
jgi:hypothetical protein